MIQSSPLPLQQSVAHSAHTLARAWQVAVRRPVGSRMGSAQGANTAPSLPSSTSTAPAAVTPAVMASAAVWLAPTVTGVPDCRPASRAADSLTRPEIAGPCPTLGSHSTWNPSWLSSCLDHERVFGLNSRVAAASPASVTNWSVRR